MRISELNAEQQEFTVECYIAEEHNDLIVELLKTRGIEESLIHDLPKTSLLAFKKGDLIAFGGLRLIEGNRAMFDSYITSPSTLPEDRDICLDLLTEKLLLFAKNEGFKQILAFSADLNTQKRANRHGFIDFPSHLFQVLSL